MRRLTLLFALLFLASGCSTTSGDDRLEPSGDIYLIKLEHAASADVAASLEQLTAGSETVRVRPHAESNSILVSGTADDVEQVHELVARLDVPR